MKQNMIYSPSTDFTTNRMSQREKICQDLNLMKHLHVIYNRNSTPCQRTCQNSCYNGFTFNRTFYSSMSLPKLPRKLNIQNPKEAMLSSLIDGPNKYRVNVFGENIRKCNEKLRGTKLKKLRIDNLQFGQRLANVNSPYSKRVIKQEFDRKNDFGKICRRTRSNLEFDKIQHSLMVKLPNFYFPNRNSKEFVNN